MSDSKSSFSVLGSPRKIVWTEVGPIEADAGIFELPRFVTNCPATDTESARQNDESEQFWWIDVYGHPTRTSSVVFPPGPWKEARTQILSRTVRNVFGSTLLDWSCSVGVWMSEDGESYLVQLDGAGGGPEGFSVVFFWTYSHADRVIDVDVVEQLPGQDARKTRLCFRVTDELKLVPTIERRRDTVGLWRAI